MVNITKNLGEFMDDIDNSDSSSAESVEKIDEEIEENNPWFAHIPKNLNEFIEENGIASFDSDCVRKKTNMSKSSNIYKFDHPDFDPKTLLNDITTHSPKLVALLNKIEELDQNDRRKYGKAFKHFIFSDVKSNSSGVKLLASALLAKNYNLGYTAELLNQKTITKDSNTVDENKKKEKKYKKIELMSENQLSNTAYNNFFLLTSIGVYDQNITVSLKKQILKLFNQRPENSYGELARIIIMDGGFKEGIDLFDIKYIHIFEPSVVAADQKQVIGRGTRTCGQKGLEFHPTKGWPLHVFVYDMDIPDKLQPSLFDSKTTFDLYLKSMNINVRLMNFAHELEKTAVYGSIDYELNQNIHSFAIPNLDDEEEYLPYGSEFIYGGVRKTKPRLIIRDEPPIVINTTNIVKGTHLAHSQCVIENQVNEHMNFTELREHIRKDYSQFAWDAVKMENLCADKTNGGAGNLLTYTPTQDFVRHYFTPQNDLKGMLLWHSVGTGKTCSAIAAATSSFEKLGYTILWVTRTTLKSDIWKNMFEQVCNEDIRDKIQNEGLVIPDDPKKRIRLVSKSWRIRPMSYKQFSNLVSKQNAFYKSLVKINGELDPLHKTLLIIDEAHKLYGGGDLSSIERPDMDALHQALMNSYQISGKDSVKLLLMTATPITQDPMELIKLMNLCKPPQQQIVSDFSVFSSLYLNETGEFTEKGREQFLDAISGHISYLNREKDARQFAQPIVERIAVPIVNNINDVETFDKKVVKNYFESDIHELKNQVEEQTRLLENEFKEKSEIDSKSFDSFYDKCDDIENPKVEKACKKVVREHIKELVSQIKEDIVNIKNQVKTIKEEIKNKQLLQKSHLSGISENVKDRAEDYENYKRSLYYQLKNQCSGTMKTDTPLKALINSHPEIQAYGEKLTYYNNHIQDLQNTLKNDTANYKKRMIQLRELLKTDLNDLEKRVVKMTMKEEKRTVRKLIREKTKETTSAVANIQKIMKATQKNREKKYKKINKTIRKIKKLQQKENKEVERAEKKLRKTLRKAGEYTEDFADQSLRDLKNTYSGIIDAELAQLDNRIMSEELVKVEAKRAKQREKEELRANKKAEKEHVRATKKAMKEVEKLAKKQERATKKAKPV